MKGVVYGELKKRRETLYGGILLTDISDRGLREEGKREFWYGCP